jgi:hypothetical protein
MKKNSQTGRSQDRKKVAGGQDHEVNYEKEKMGVSGRPENNFCCGFKGKCGVYW